MLFPQEVKELEARFLWLEKALRLITLCVGDDLVILPASIVATVNPLQRIVTVALRRPATKASRDPIRTILRHFAVEGECHLPRIDITDVAIKVEVLLKSRFTKARLRT